MQSVFDILTNISNSILLHSFTGIFLVTRPPPPPPPTIQPLHPRGNSLQDFGDQDHKEYKYGDPL
jgi:hypothetical protein